MNGRYRIVLDRAGSGHELIVEILRSAKLRLDEKTRSLNLCRLLGRLPMTAQFD